MKIEQLRNKWVVKEGGKPSRNFYNLEEAEAYVRMNGQTPNKVEDPSISLEESKQDLQKAMEAAYAKEEEEATEEDTSSSTWPDGFV